MEALLKYLRETYAPLAVILYGSWADGSQGEHSDLDALVLTDGGAPCHDTSRVQGVQLDVFVYPAQSLEGHADLSQVMQIEDGRVLLDSQGRGEALLSRVRAYGDRLPMKTAEEAREGVVWCEKMMERASRGDAEGYFRWHWLLTDSLEIYCDTRALRYRGPKKTLRWMAAQAPEDYACYARALREFTHESLRAWVECLKQTASR